MLRTLFLVLLLANGLLLAASSGLFDTGGDREREPERLQRQHQPALVKVLDPQAAEAALAAASAAVAASAAQAAVACVEAGPFPATEAAAAERSLREAGLAIGSWQALRHDEGGAWMVYMGRYPDREMLQRKLAELARLKLQAEDLHNTPELQPGISLGRFDDAERARAALAQMAQRGVRTARVITLEPPQTLTLLRLPAADGALRARLAALQLPGGMHFGACAAAGASPPASAAAAASAAIPAAKPTATSAASAAAPTPVATASAPAARATAPVAPVAAKPPQPQAASATAPAVRASTPIARGQVGAASTPAAAPAVQARVASADTRAALQRAASAAAAEAAAARQAAAGSAPASR